MIIEIYFYRMKFWKEMLFSLFFINDIINPALSYHQPIRMEIRKLTLAN